MDRETKFHVLWVDDQLIPGDDVTVIKEKLEKFNSSLVIETCCNGDDFIRRANEGTIWDAFIIDVNLPKSDVDKSPQEIIASIVDGITTVIERQKVLLFCFSGAPQIKGATSEGMHNNYLGGKGFHQNSKTKMYFYLKGELATFFSDLSKALEQKNGPFKDYPEFGTIYAMANAKGKQFIDDLLKWKNGELKDLTWDSLNNIRTIFEDAIEPWLENKGFFYYHNQTKKKIRFYEIINLVSFNSSGGYDHDYLNEKCRSKWEAAAINFVAHFASIPHHGSPETYDQSFQNMIFDSFVIFSRWFVRFKEDYEKSGWQMSNFITNYTQPKRLDGYIDKSLALGKSYWIVKDNNGNEYRIKDQSLPRKKGEAVTFLPSSQSVVIYPSANDIQPK